MADCKPGDEVSVFAYGSGAPGVIKKVRRTLLHIRYHGRTGAFRKERPEKDRPTSGTGVWFEIAADTANRQRRAAAGQALKDCHLHITRGRAHDFSTEQLEAVVALVRSFSPADGGA